MIVIAISIVGGQIRPFQRKGRSINVGGRIEENNASEESVCADGAKKVAS